MYFRASAQAAEAFVTIDLEGQAGFRSVECGLPDYNWKIDGRELAVRLVDFLRHEGPGFAASYVAAWPARAGVRESRRIVGSDIDWRRTISSKEDASFPMGWPLPRGRWNYEKPQKVQSWRFPTGDEPCAVPLRALQAAEDEALFMAGRCISCSHEAQASVRVIGTCLATGEAAGLAAALKVLHGDGDEAMVNVARAKIAHEHR